MTMLVLGSRRTGKTDAMQAAIAALAAQGIAVQVVHARPDKPVGGADIWYRGWEAGFDFIRDDWSPHPWVAYKGGCDLDAPEVSSATWAGLLDEIDEAENA